MINDCSVFHFHSSLAAILHLGTFSILEAHGIGQPNHLLSLAVVELTWKDLPNGALLSFGIV